MPSKYTRPGRSGVGPQNTPALVGAASTVDAQAARPAYCLKSTTAESRGTRKPSAVAAECDPTSRAGLGFDTRAPRLSPVITDVTPRIPTPIGQ